MPECRKRHLADRRTPPVTLETLQHSAHRVCRLRGAEGGTYAPGQLRIFVAGELGVFAFRQLAAILALAADAPKHAAGGRILEGLAVERVARNGGEQACAHER